MRKRGGLRVLVAVMCWALLALGGGAPSMAAGPGVATMSTGSYHTCVVRTDHTVWCWGFDGYGELGDGTTGDGELMRTSPVQVRRGSSTLKGVTKVAGGAAFTCAVRTDGTAWCWGLGDLGQLGDGASGTGHHRTRAVEVRRGSGHLTRVERVAAGGRHACALRTDGSVWCWGSDLHGQLGDATTGDATSHIRTKAVRVRLGRGYLDDVVTLAAGYSHTCAVRRDGSAWCWGDGSDGQLGDDESGTGHQRTKPIRVRRGSLFLSRVSGIAAGDRHTCVRRTDGSAWCWGYGEYGQLGDGTTGDPTSHLRVRPVQVLRGSGVLTGVTGIEAGGYHTCARRSNGSAYCWGHAEFGQLGDGTTGDGFIAAVTDNVRVTRPSGSFTEARKVDGGAYHMRPADRPDGVVLGSQRRRPVGPGVHDDDALTLPRKVPFPEQGAAP
ncbi:MAG: hypothetical protein R3C32_11370 [Chloroflexota bacterium]